MLPYEIWLDSRSSSSALKRGTVRAIVPVRSVWYTWYYPLLSSDVRSMSLYRTLHFLFIYIQQIKNKKSNSLVELGNDEVVLTFFWLNYGTTKQWSLVFGFTWRASFLTSRGGSCLRKVMRPSNAPKLRKIPKF